MLTPRAAALQSESAPLAVALTGSVGNIGYALLPLIASGLAFGPDRRIALRLLDLPMNDHVLQGVAAELGDAGYPLLSSVFVTTEVDAAFQGADWVVLVGSQPRTKGMERAELLERNSSIFREQGTALNRVAKPTTRVLVVGNPANTNALIAQRSAPKIPAENFAALTQLDHQRARLLLAERLGVTPFRVRKVAIWGNHSSTQVPDFRAAEVDGVSVDASRSMVAAVAADREWTDQFVAGVQQRGAHIIKLLGRSSALSAAAAIANCLRNWSCGTAPDDWTSMAVLSDKNPYGIAPGIFFSFPVTVRAGGAPQIVGGLDFAADDRLRQRIRASEEELIQERDLAKI